MSLSKPIKKSKYYIEDKTDPNLFILLKDIDNKVVMSKGDYVQLPYTSTCNGFIYNKEQTYLVNTIVWDTVAGFVHISLTRYKEK